MLRGFKHQFLTENILHRKNLFNNKCSKMNVSKLHQVDVKQEGVGEICIQFIKR